MTKLRLQIPVLAFLLLARVAVAQSNYNLYVQAVDKDSTFLYSHFEIPTEFVSRFACSDFINKLPAYFQSKGYVTASIDSLHYDSLFARVVLFIGQTYAWDHLDARNVDPTILDAVGWREQQFEGKVMDFAQVQRWEDRILDYLENNGHPFARVSIDSVQLDNDKITAQIHVVKGPLYKIDSIRLYGKAKISNVYLQKYLNIPNGSIYQKDKLQQINKKIRDLSYVEEEYPASLSRLGSGSVLNLYLKPKRSSQVNVLIGFLPNSDQSSSKKLLITGEANINLKNALGAGETIGLNWQQLQAKSPRLNLLYQHPYIFNSPLGLDFAFDMFRKDSTYLNVNLQLGAQYILNTREAGKLFIQRFQTLLNGVNTALLLESRELPDVADVSSWNVGIDYDFNNTDYRLNPKKGSQFHIITSVGTKNIKKNSAIVDLKDPNDPNFDFNSLYDTVKLKTYQFRIQMTVEKYFPLGRQRSTIKTAFNGGMFQSGNVFRNELFQIGGYKLLRGFDEESQYLSHYAIGTVEYHYLVGQNSYFYLLADGGWGRDKSQHTKIDYEYFGAGMGLVFETKAGIFNLAWAVGKRNDTPFNLRQSKIHFGFVNYF